MTAPRRPRLAWLLVGSTPSVWLKVERAPALEEVLGELAVVLGARAFAGGLLEQGAELCPERRDLRLQSGPVAVGLVDVPGGEEVVCDHASCAAEVVLF